MEIRTTAFFDKNLAKKLKRDSKLKEKVKKQVGLLKKNPRHPSLRLHKLSGKRAEEYSFWIEGNLRITFIAVGRIVILTDIITHDKY